jgi:Divergent InlB B-repeat domain
MRKALFIATAACALWLAPGALASGWCGSGESAIDRPDTVTGAQVHAIVATPSDSPDLFGADANRLADDVASMSAWWTGQDPTRVPRYDQATFPGGTCLDISFVRLSQPAAAYQGSAAFRLVSLELATDGFIDEFMDYVVYYDGASVQDICGTGAGDFNSGGAYAIVWLNGCTDIPSDGIQTHELLHAFGALPLGAPNACTAATDPFGVDDSGHPCDSPTDVLYPEADPARPLSQQVLDYNHDDYYAHSGSWPDIQDTVFLRHLNTPEVALGVTLSGPGQVTSDLPGVNCTASCTTQWDQGSAVTLAATPGNTTRFVQWTGGCVGKADCALDLAQAASVTAVFGPLRIPVRITTSGKGTVACAPRKCAKTFSAGDRLTLRAVPAKGWKFASWSGACTGSRLTCSPKTDFALAVHANFKKKR